MPKAQGKRTDLEPSNTVLPSSDTPTLSDLGITKMQSSRWQSIAAVPDEVFEAEIIEVKAKNMELTSARKLIVQARRTH